MCYILNTKVHCPVFAHHRRLKFLLVGTMPRPWPDLPFLNAASLDDLQWFTKHVAWLRVSSSNLEVAQIRIRRRSSNAAMIVIASTALLLVLLPKSITFGTGF